MISWIKRVYGIIKYLLSPQGREYLRRSERLKKSEKADRDLENVLGVMCSQLVDREMSSDLGKRYSTSVGPYLYGVGIKLSTPLRIEEKGTFYYIDSFYMPLEEIYSKGFKVRPFETNGSFLEKMKLAKMQQGVVKEIIQQ